MDLLAVLGLKREIKELLHRHPEIKKFATEVQKEGVQQTENIRVEMRGRSRSHRLEVVLNKEDINFINKWLNK